MIPIHLDTGAGPARPRQTHTVESLDRLLVEDKATGDYRLAGGRPGPGALSGHPRR